MVFRDAGRVADHETDVQEKEHQLSVETILRACEIKEGQPVSVEQIEAVFERFPQLVEGAKRNFYWEVRQALSSDFELRFINHGTFVRPPDPYAQQCGEVALVKRFQEKSPRSKLPPWSRTDDLKTEREEIFGDRKQEVAVAEILFKIPSSSESPSLTILLSTPRQQANLYWNEGGLFATFTHPNDFSFDGIFILEGFEGPKTTLAAAKEKGTRFDYQLVKTMIEELIPFPDTDVKAAIGDLRKLAKTEGVSREDLKKMEQAIQDFATFVKPPPKNLFAEIGRCLTVPHSFSDYCRKRFGLPVDEETYGNGISFFHQVNRWGSICIDWTARQYAAYDDAPYPRIYLLDEPLLGSYKPCSQWTEQEKEEAGELKRLAASGREF